LTGELVCFFSTSELSSRYGDGQTSEKRLLCSFEFLMRLIMSLFSHKGTFFNGLELVSVAFGMYGCSSLTIVLRLSRCVLKRAWWRAVLNC
jgi:hypothetical protein